jgi:glycosyltransferase involved in cell wall biosynthesis
MWRNGPLRVGYVTKRYPRYSETFVVAEIAAHEAAGLDVEIFSLFPPNDTHFQDAIARVRAPVCYLPSQGVKAVDLWAALEEASATIPGMWSELEAARGVDALSVCQAAVLACEVRRRRIGHLHAPSRPPRRGGAAGQPLASALHVPPTPRTSSTRRSPEDCAEARRAAAVITVSDYNRDYLTQAHGAAAARVHRLYNGLDLAEFRYESPRGRPPWIAAVGRLVEKKGFADLIEACAILRARGGGVDFRCDIVGTGPLEPMLQDLVQRHGLVGRVQLLGPRPRCEVIEHIRGAAVLAAPCIVGSDGDRDGMPTVLLEAMAVGTPCVATNVTAIPELLTPGDAGLVVPERDPHALAGALERLLTDSTLRERSRRRHAVG